MPIFGDGQNKIYYEIHGEGEPIVLIAGYTCDHLAFDALIEHLSNEYQLVLFDNRAVGQTKIPGGSFSIKDMANDTLHLIEELNLKKPALLGQSMGGAIAQTLAVYYPSNINKIILLNSVSHYNFVPVTALETLLNLRKLGISFDILMNATLPWLFSSNYLAKVNQIDRLKKAALNIAYPQSLMDQERQFNALKSFDLRDRLQDILLPTLIVASEEDALISVNEVRQLAKSIKNSEFHIIPGGHASTMEQPEKLSEVIIEFLQSP